MRFTQSLAPALLVLAGVVQATSWGFDDGSVSVVAKRAGDAGSKERFTSKTLATKPISLGSTDTLKISLTAKDNGSGKRPHQAFVILKEKETGLEAPFPLTVKENGKAVTSITHKDLPVQFLITDEPLEASIVLGSFGSSKALDAPVFDVKLQKDPNVPLPSYEKPVRYGKKEEIHHIFRADPQSPPKVISIVFALAVLATIPVLFISWAFLGANLNHLSKAIGAAPVSHATFFGSLLAMEGVFFLYYTTWNLFQALPVIGAVAVVTVLSGTKALGEVQSRRLAGER
ncbi:Dolichyl-diphosphooligosaccharide--protein glycosyltransferase subunit Swp1 [Triangularia verruculosa]|uniref:Dolichyl-diphosphooligosaccharide--protein glycosyltransferase subunit Swp1 n=1 Tax=Triangularia verruculosa TaxID=2587418 RepID=A0AAN7B0L0_9PEZI|nr:Dolichyl-diphosphooligosaccharide--protein glycosyltransferase subunit Swp1 [Triangularia verruculosa]